jgi:hypothetical protein
LTFGEKFNQNIKDRIPIGVTNLTINNLFAIDIHIPPSVIHLTIKYWYLPSTKNYIPTTIEYLVLGYYCGPCIEAFFQSDYIPSTIKQITICYKRDFDSITDQTKIAYNVIFEKIEL